MARVPVAFVCNTRHRQAATLLAFSWLLVACSSPDKPTADAPSYPATEFRIQLPSSVAGSEGLAVHVLAPASPGRYASGAPIAISVPGGWKSGGGEVDAEFVAHGFVSIGWLMPGSSDPDASSGGSFDVRGETTLRALADVTLYAMGKHKDSEGKSIDERLPYAQPTNIGYVAKSNGGNMAIAALAHHPDELASLAWIAAWESPLGDQQANIELNNNPHYLPGMCNATSCSLDAQFPKALRWNQSATTEARHDKTLSELGRLELQGASPELFATLPATQVAGTWTYFFSQELSAVLREQPESFFGATGAPPWLELDASKVKAFWQPRDGSLNIATVAAAMPNMRIIHIQRQKDHVQSQPDYPHATAHLLGWQSAKHSFFRLNPDAVYQALALGRSELAGLPENDARTTIEYPGAKEQMVPNNVAAKLQLAASLELADRTAFDNSEPDIDNTLANYEVDNTGSSSASGSNGQSMGPRAIPCDQERTSMCCGDGQCTGPENQENCSHDCDS